MAGRQVGRDLSQLHTSPNDFIMVLSSIQRKKRSPPLAPGQVSCHKEIPEKDGYNSVVVNGSMARGACLKGFVYVWIFAHAFRPFDWLRGISRNNRRKKGLMLVLLIIPQRLQAFTEDILSSGPWHRQGNSQITCEI